MTPEHPTAPSPLREALAKALAGPGWTVVPAAWLVAADDCLAAIRTALLEDPTRAEELGQETPEEAWHRGFREGQQYEHALFGVYAGKPRPVKPVFAIHTSKP